MAEEENEEIEQSHESYRVLVVNISWKADTTRRYNNRRTYRIKDLPKQFDLNIPEGVLKNASKDGNDFNDVIETFVYNQLPHIFGYEVLACRIALPLENE